MYFLRYNSYQITVLWHRVHHILRCVLLLFALGCGFFWSTCEILWIPFIFDRCHCSSAAATPDKNDRDIQLVVSILLIFKNLENNRTEEINWLTNKHPCFVTTLLDPSLNPVFLQQWQLLIGTSSFQLCLKTLVRHYSWLNQGTEMQNYMKKTTLPHTVL